ncbi:uncharacterized protein N7484_000492 [Penicillium longicatenatum]|uniref:uncharacterized protein n=1 Tax=Penicillium longicatenatum TaxID=1561947 RepID=UPI00254916F3|nr:uncharacterized protein N7484_000492 [Penicillium longicatenatum]KAJ5661120.1 hypothetical protein N7484_000492 [Penicillium longicatenatum]
MSEASPDQPTHLEPPSKTTELEDPGAEDIASSSDDDHFSDASEGHAQLKQSPPSGNTSPVPSTRVERVDDSAQHGEIPGTEAYEKRAQDAVPDEIEVIPEDTQSKDQAASGPQDRPITPEASPIPHTVVEKVDPEEPSYGEVPGTEAHEKRLADAVPDIVTKAPDHESNEAPSLDDTPSDNDSTTQPIPETRVSKVDTLPLDEVSSSGPTAHQSSASDAEPDTVEIVPDAPEPTSQGGAADGSEEAEEEAIEAEADDFGDDFDEFVDEAEEMGDDDFGDFDDGFQEPTEMASGTTTPPQPPAPTVPPLADFSAYKSTSELLASLQGTLDNLLPTSDITTLPKVEPISDQTAIFNTERSLSLWSQLVAPPPLQPQNWVKSRIRRLFLVSLGVPVDLDEILPASKQKKLVLPSIDLDSGSNTPATRSRSQPRKGGEGEASAETDGAAQAPRTKARRGAAPPPQLDLSAVRRLCATTDAALNGLTDSELKDHAAELEAVTLRASEVLEYWLKRRDGLIGEKEAFEGVIENLVSHVRRVRK